MNIMSLVDEESKFPKVRNSMLSGYINSCLNVLSEDDDDLCSLLIRTCQAYIVMDLNELTAMCYGVYSEVSLQS